MTRCKGCGKEFRKGTIACLLVPGEGFRGARICQECASDGVLLVAPKLAPVVAQKVVRSDGVERVLRMLNTYAKMSRSSANAEAENIAVSSHHRGRAEGFEGAIEAIKRECGGES
jgi:hypothetical protein